MKRSALVAVRDASRRAQRFDLLRYDVPDIVAPSEGVLPAASSASTPEGLDPKAMETLVNEGLQQMLPALVDAKVQALGGALRAEVQEESAQLQAQLEEGLSSAAQPVQAAHATASATTASSAAASSFAPQSPSAPAAKSAPASAATAPAVRVIQRKSLSGEAALREGVPSLARKAPAQQTQPALAPRCLAHASQHYLGASEEDVLAVWNSMRERYRLTPENKIVPRRSFLDWLQRERNVCASNIHWYGDFVAVRSCPVRLPEDHPGHGVDGWFLLFDPNGETFLRAQLFAEAYEASPQALSGGTPKLARPAWVSEERRAAASARQGADGARPFSPDTADDLTSNDFFRGLAE